MSLIVFHRMLKDNHNDFVFEKMTFNIYDKTIK